MEFLKLAQARYSCKQYSARQVEGEKLETILEAGRLAPTAKNSQEQRVYVLQSPSALAAVDAATPCRYGAPTVLAVAVDLSGVYPYPGGEGDSGPEDGSIVATHMMLCAASLGVDSCWVNNFEPRAMAKALGIPEGERLILLLDLGYAAEGAGPLANHLSRKPLSETVRYL